MRAPHHSTESEDTGHRIRDLDESRHDWEELFEQLEDPSFYHRWEFHRAARDNLAPTVEFHWFYEGPEPKAIVPLERTDAESFMSTELRLPHHSDMPLRDCVALRARSTDRWSEALLSSVRRPGEKDPAAVRFHCVPERSYAAATFPPGRSRIRAVPVGARMYCSVATPESLDSLSSKNLKNLARLRRRAARDCGKITRLKFTGPDAPEAGLEAFVRVESASWKGPDGAATSLCCTPEIRAFYRDLLGSFGKTGDARVDVLLIAGDPAAALLALRSGTSWNLQKIAFDGRFSQFGPGGILLKEFIEEMTADEDISEISLVTAPDWAARWHMQEETTFDIAVFPATLRGRVRLLRHDAIRATRRLKARFARSSEK